MALPPCGFLEERMPSYNLYRSFVLSLSLSILTSLGFPPALHGSRPRASPTGSLLTAPFDGWVRK